MSTADRNENSDEDSFMMVTADDCADVLLESLDARGQPTEANVPDTELKDEFSSRAPMAIEADYNDARLCPGGNESHRDLISTHGDVSVPAASGQGASFDLGTDTSAAELSLSSQPMSGLRIPSQEAEVVTVSLEFFQQHPSLVPASFANNNSIPIVPNSQESIGSYRSLNEDAYSLPSSQESYSEMNPDSPAGSQPQSYASLPVQFPSQSSQTQTSADSGVGASSREFAPPDSFSTLLTESRIRLFPATASPTT